MSIMDRPLTNQESTFLVRWLRKNRKVPEFQFDQKYFLKMTVAGAIAELKTAIFSIASVKPIDIYICDPASRPARLTISTCRCSLSVTSTSNTSVITLPTLLIMKAVNIMKAAN
jgi:hypothetical protein